MGVYVLKKVSCIIACESDDAKLLADHKKDGESSKRFDQRGIKAKWLPAGRRHNPEGLRRVEDTLRSKGLHDVDPSRYVGLELSCVEDNRMYLEEEIQRIMSLFKEAKKPAVVVGE